MISVDVEEYFQVEAFREQVSMDSWNSYPTRVLDNVHRILDLFDEFNTKATFFCVGWIAEKYPQLIRDIHDHGHELGCHSYWHRTVFSLDPEEFRRDTRLACDAIQQACGVRVIGYRAPSWSITRQSLWALDVLAEEGFQYDSSIFPIRHDIYGIPGAERFAHTRQLENGRQLREFPPTTVRIRESDFPAAGGGYLRIFPMTFTRWAFGQIEKQNQPVMVYFHPWEVDPAQPRIAGAQLKSKLRHYTNLEKMEARIRILLESYKFQPVAAKLSEHTGPTAVASVPRVPAPTLNRPQS